MPKNVSVRKKNCVFLLSSGVVPVKSSISDEHSKIEVLRLRTGLNVCPWLQEHLYVYGDSHSDYATCSRGVPQCSVLGTIPFVIYVSKLAQCPPAEVSNLEYADDIIMLECTDVSPSTACRSLSTAVTALGTWLEDR